MMDCESVMLSPPAKRYRMADPETTPEVPAEFPRFDIPRVFDPPAPPAAPEIVTTFPAWESVMLSPPASVYVPVEMFAVTPAVFPAMTCVTDGFANGIPRSAP